MFFGDKENCRPYADACCGCSACVNICPKSAISMGHDSDGFLMPKVDMDLCVECGLCEKACPMVHGADTLGADPRCYMAINKDHTTLMESSSGGLFSAICDYVLKQDGLVYGAAFDHDMQLHHVAVGNADQMPGLRGSKYIQSDNLTVYSDIRDALKQGRTVYYTGTGCQVAGLKLFLRKDYENLITTDILCHGVPPQQVFDWVVRHLESKYGGKVVAYRFRDKRVNGWSCSSSSSIRIGDKVKYVGFDPTMKAYFNAFLSGAMYRESCYVCPFATSRRSGDITLGDYWDVGRYHKPENIFDGVSAILVNTPKGQAILDKICKDLVLEPTRLEDIAVVNKTLRRPSKRHKARDEFFSSFKENPERTLAAFVKFPTLSKAVFKIKDFLNSHTPYYRRLMNLKRKL